MKKYKNHPLKKLNYLEVDVFAKYYVELFSRADLTEFLEELNSGEFKNEKIFLLGEGACTLFTKDFDGVVVRYLADDIIVVKEDDKNIYLEVESGRIWDDLVNYCIDNEYGGIENMIMVPGTVGAAAVGNIACYGQSFLDCFESLEAVEVKSGKDVTFTKDDDIFEYRNSIFKSTHKGQYIITTVTFKLNKIHELTTNYWSHKHGVVDEKLKEIADEPYTIRDVANAISEIRKQKFPDPEVYGCCGSFFKNPVITAQQLHKVAKDVPNIQYYPVAGLNYVPNEDPMKVDHDVKVALGQIIDDGLDLTGVWHGNVGMHETHGITLITNKKATPQEIMDYVDFIKDAVFDKYGIEFECEVEYI